MEQLFKKLQQLNDLLKVNTGAVVAPIKPIKAIKPATPNDIAPKVKTPSLAPRSTKNPIKQLAQKDNAEKMRNEAMRIGKSEELLVIANNGQWALEKSNYGKIKESIGVSSQYDVANNIKRKVNNVDDIPSLGNNRSVKRYTSAVGSGSTGDQLDREMKALKAKNKKQPVLNAANSPRIAAEIIKRNKVNKA